MTSKKGINAIRAAWLDATDDTRDRAVARLNHAVGDEQGWGYRAGQWAGAPKDKLPPHCPVTPLGRDGETYWFLDSMQQLNGVHRDKWGKKMLLDLFSATPNFLEHHWPRWGKPDKKGDPAIMNGVEVDSAIGCLMFAAAKIGAVEIDARVRGRGAWATKTGELVWHAGEAIYRLQNGRLKASAPCSIDNTVYPGAAPIMSPWLMPVTVDECPARDLLQILKSWNFERGALDPVLIIGWLGCAFLGGALDWRPYIFFIGGAGVGKSYLQRLLRAVFDEALIKTSNASEASLRQFGKRDSLPIMIDEFEAKDDNRKTQSVIELARIAASGDDILRGGADHHGAKFTMRSAFMFSAINAPPMEAADKSRMAMINLSRITVSAARKPPVINGETVGRMVLRRLMDGWPDFPRALENWRAALRSADFSDRAQMTYGTLLAAAELLLGVDVLIEEGLPLDNPEQLGEKLQALTAVERADQVDNWVECIFALFAATIDAWKDGQKPTVGGVIDDTRHGGMELKHANQRLHLVGLHMIERDGAMLLAVPIPVKLGPHLIFRDTKFKDGVWTGALKQAPQDVVIRDLGQGQNVKFNGVTARALLIDIAAWDAWQADNGG